VPARIRWKAEAWFNAGGMILGGVILLFSVLFGFGTLRQPGPGLFPALAGALILVTSGLRFRKGRREAPPSAPLFAQRELRTLLRMLTLLAGWILAMPLLGYVAVTFVTTFFLAREMGLERLVKPLLLAVGTTLLCYLLFDLWLYLDLPRGFWAS
jgi:putative tricarboxylic transport membrane protein